MTAKCLTHGEKNVAWVCSHFPHAEDDTPLGFFQGHVLSEPFSNDPCGWCNTCDETLERAGWVWNDELLERACFIFTCDMCFDEMRREHEVANRQRS